jgi:hypothetical protein
MNYSVSNLTNKIPQVNHIMTPQQAYLKGLDDAENNFIKKFIAIMNGEDDDTPFANPKLETLRRVIQERTDYFLDMSTRTNNVGVGFRSRIEEQKEKIKKLQ